MPAGFLSRDPFTKKDIRLDVCHHDVVGIVGECRRIVFLINDHYNIQDIVLSKMHFVSSIAISVTSS